MSNYFIFFLYTNHVFIHQVSRFSFKKHLDTTNWWNFHQLVVSKCFCIQDILSQTNQHQSLLLLRFQFLHFVSALSNPSLFVKIVIFLSCFSCFWSRFFLRWCYVNLVSTSVSFKTDSGESKAVTPEMVAVWNETTLPTLLSNYGLENIYKADKFGLFYQCLPENPISWKQRNVQVVHTTKPGSLVWQLLTLLAINCYVCCW